MAIFYEHIQEAKSEYMISSGAQSQTLSLGAATRTDYEVWRSLINPGFNGTISWLSLRMNFSLTGTATANTVTGKWQIRERGGASWVDIGAIGSHALTAAPEYVKISEFVHDATADSNAAPYELRLIISSTAAQTISLLFGESGYSVFSLATRTVGESV
jgi:hypothetical protein